MKPSAARYLPLIEPLETRQLLSAGQLDVSFGDDGKVVTDLGLNGFGATVAIQADGKIVSTSGDDGLHGVHLVRHNVDGSVDTSFGDGGVTTTEFDGDTDVVESLAVQPDGKILLAGRSWAETSSTLVGTTVIVRYNADGSVDTTFGDDGVVRLAGDTYNLDGSTFGTFSPGPAVMALQGDGTILITQVLGDDHTTAGPDLNLYRLTDSGALDTTFGVGGKVVTDLGVIERPRDMALQADGKIVLAVDGPVVLNETNRTSWPAETTYLVRYNADGSLDTTFGDDGVVTEHATAGQISINRIAIGLDGKVLALGEDLDGRSFLIRYNTDGTRDVSFGNGGRLDLNIASGGVGGILVQPDGKLLLTGSGSADPDDHPGFLSQRLKTDGTLDTGYGAGGSTYVTVGGQSDFGTAAALQQDGSIIIVGFMNKTGSGGGDHSDIAMIRLTGDAGASGSRHATLRRGYDQQGEYTGRASKHRHRSPKRRAMEEAAKARKKHRSPKRRAMELAQQRQLPPPQFVQSRRALTFAPTTTMGKALFGTTEVVDEDQGVLG